MLKEQASNVTITNRLATRQNRTSKLGIIKMRALRTNPILLSAARKAWTRRVHGAKKKPSIKGFLTDKKTMKGNHMIPDLPFRIAALKRS
jgi:hypothetical protein